MSKLTKIFSNVLGIDETKITPELSPENNSSWDSLNAIVLLTEMEKVYAIKFTMKEAMAVKNFGDVEKLIVSHGKDPHEE